MRFKIFNIFLKNPDKSFSASDISYMIPPTTYSYKEIESHLAALNHAGYICRDPQNSNKYYLPPFSHFAYMIDKFTTTFPDMEIIIRKKEGA